ncbi:MAG: nucleotide exchange factor GrpE [Turicibacter sp.]|nr:nucleotide exchange factor GrpE [Turicibacter sp.]
MNSTHENSPNSNWENLYTACKKQVAGLIENAEIGTFIAGRITLETGQMRGLTAKDEELYTNCQNIFHAYKESIQLYEQFKPDISSPVAIEILDGIVTVLVSRLREFEEINNYCAGNPISNEKKSITGDILGDLDDCIEKFIEPLTLEWLENNGEWSPTTWKYELYELYRERFNLCKLHLNDLNNRPEAQKYLDLMEYEREILATIITIQVRALEQAVERGDTGANTIEKIGVQKILSILREAYQHFGRALTEISAAFHEEDDTAPEPFEIFDEDLDRLFGVVLLEDTQIRQELAIFTAFLNSKIDAIFSDLKVNFLKTIYTFRKTVNTEMMLANEMIQVFVNLREKWPKILPTDENGENSESNEYKEGVQILDGVGETIEIKVDGMKDALAHITADCNKLIESITPTAPTDEEIATVKATAWQLWLKNPDFIAFREACLEFPALSNHKQAQDKLSTTSKDKLEKKLAKFKRETLLYEISTYEEIIFYSVSRLRNLSFEPFQTAVLQAEAALSAIEIILKKDNIDLIRPNPHDSFNPKEHEVLMAESKPDFKKGEIIKLMNSGYRQRDSILMRANVIAAR